MEPTTEYNSVAMRRLVERDGFLSRFWDGTERGLQVLFNSEVLPNCAMRRQYRACIG